jgi:chemotaxis protein methyltransferase CheR
MTDPESDPGTTASATRSTRQANRRDAEALAFVVDLVYDRCRIRLHDGKHALIRARLGKRMRALGLDCLADYCDLLRQPDAEDEITHAVDALTTNFTGFLREEDHFRFIVDKAIPALLPPRHRRFRLWSAACASGEEPFTLAVYLDEKYPLAEGWDWQILATDISTKALAKARAAIYPSDRLDCLPDSLLRKHFQRGVNTAAGLFRVKHRLRDRVRFEHHNLLAPAPTPDLFEIILCRNVMIYFDRPTQLQVVTTLARFLVPSGYLLIGHSESLNGLSVPLRCIRPSYYQKL